MTSILSIWEAKRALAKSDVPAPEPELPSVGSRLHATGALKAVEMSQKRAESAAGRPVQAMCLVLEGGWLPQRPELRSLSSVPSRSESGHVGLRGCSGEAKARKQAKVAAIRAKSGHWAADSPRNLKPQGESEASAVMQVPVLSAPVLQAPVVYQAVLSPYPTLLNPWRNTSLCATNCVPHTTRSYPGLCYGTPEAGDRRTLQELCPAVQKEPLPSKGSALHAEGRCSPCAWFWKPQGCHHGTECGRCHLCPASEIKLRRKAKVLKDAKAEVRLGSQH